MAVFGVFGFLEMYLNAGNVVYQEGAYYVCAMMPQFRALRTSIEDVLLNGAVWLNSLL